MILSSRILWKFAIKLWTEKKYFAGVTKTKCGLNFPLIFTRTVCIICVFFSSSLVALPLISRKTLQRVHTINVAKQMTIYCNCYYNHIKRLLKHSWWFFLCSPHLFIYSIFPFSFLFYLATVSMNNMRHHYVIIRMLFAVFFMWHL